MTAPITMRDGPHMRKCSACGKQFKRRQAADHHIGDAHKGNAHRVAVPRTKRQYEQSYADRLIDAKLNVAMGLPADDLEIELMFGDEL